jgi:tetratricopeptide (TPR) repeat protein
MPYFCFHYKSSINHQINQPSNQSKMKKSILIIIFLLGCISYSQTATDFVNIGLEKAKAKDYKGAISEYDKAIEKDSLNALTYFYRGVSNYHLEDNDGAIKDFTKSIKLNPKYAESYSYRGYTFIYMEKFQEAYGDFEKAVELEPNADNYCARGIIKDRTLNYIGAIEDLSMAIKLRPGFAHAYFVRAYSKYNLGQHEEACVDWTTAMTLGKEMAKEVIKKLCK